MYTCNQLNWVVLFLSSDLEPKNSVALSSHHVVMSKCGCAYARPSPQGRGKAKSLIHLNVVICKSQSSRSSDLCMHKRFPLLGPIRLRGSSSDKILDRVSMCLWTKVINLVLVL